MITVVKNTTHGSESPATRTTSSRRIYESLHRRIVTNEFLPGLPISENEIATHYGVSRTPVREALRRLEQDRLVTRGRGGRGYNVRVFDLDEMDEVYEVRIALEELALRTLAARLTPQLEESLWHVWRTTPETGTPQEALAGDEHFHRALAEAAGNRALLEFLERVNHRIHIIRGIDFTVDERRAVSRAEHQAILSALVDGNTDEASRLLREHILRSKAICERLATEGLAMVYRPRRKEDSLDLSVG
ncbi:MAG TPA: GntR family transcriptional regulator [Thermoleophilia bacterium]|nr:GntR family transcriptional regulator [Thermoleophilia bacterium]